MAGNILDRPYIYIRELKELAHVIMGGFQAQKCVGQASSLKIQVKVGLAVLGLKSEKSVM